MNRIVIDTDPGVDDAHAIMMAAAHPTTRVDALTVVAGNVSVACATANALIILDVLNKDIPIFAGCDDAMVRPTPRRAISHGADGLGDSGYPPSARKPCAEHAVNALVRMANASPGELTLVALGPLTNVALATCLDPSLPKKYKHLMVLGGATQAMGNSWNATTEFNFYVDPEAAAVVLSRWPGLTLVPWETVMAHALSSSQVEELTALKSSRAEFFRRTIQRYRMTEKMPGTQILYEPDPLAMAVVLEPDIVQRAELRFVEVELSGLHTRGQTVADWFGVSGQPSNVNVIREVDQGRFWELLKLALVD